MPDYQGAQAWGEAFKSLSSGLFPDPSKQAHAYYYGAEARKAQAEAAKAASQQAAEQYLLMRTQPGLQQPAPMTWSPGTLPGFAPTLNAPGNLPMSSVMVPGPAQPPAITNPAQIVQAIPTIAAPMTQGTPPPVSAPSAVAPPAPNATGSDGSVPGQDPVSGVFHPASITDPNGGQKQSGPAAPNGSPAQLPPNLNVQGITALAAASGYDAAKAGLIGTAAAAEAYRQGLIDKHTLQVLMAGSGQAAPWTTQMTSDVSLRGHELSAGAAIRGHELSAQAQRDVANINQAGQDRRDRVLTMGPDGPVWTPGAQAAGQPAYESGLAVERERLGGQNLQTQPGGPGTPSIPSRADVAQRDKVPLYDPAVENTRTQAKVGVHNWIDPKNPTVLVPASNEDAIARGYWAVPKDPNEWSALAAYASSNVADPEQAQTIRDKVMAFAATTQPKPATPEHNAQEQALINQRLQNQMPVPTSTFPGSNTATNTEPAAASPNLSIALRNLTDQYNRLDPQTRGNPIASADKAIKQMIEDGYINPNQSRGLSITGEPTSIMQPVTDKNGNVVDQAAHFRVDLLDPKTKKPYAAGQVPNIAMRKSLSSTIPNPAPGGTPATSATPATQAGAPIGQAPAGTPDGPASVGGKPVIVRGGLIYPAPAQ